MGLPSVNGESANSAVAMGCKASDFDQLSVADLHAYRELLTWDDTDLLDLVNCKIEADAPHLQPVIDRLRRA